jgi:hypothetical protein
LFLCSLALSRRGEAAAGGSTTTRTSSSGTRRTDESEESSQSISSLRSSVTINAWTRKGAAWEAGGLERDGGSGEGVVVPSDTIEARGRGTLAAGAVASPAVLVVGGSTSLPDTTVGSQGAEGAQAGIAKRPGANEELEGDAGGSSRSIFLLLLAAPGGGQQRQQQQQQQQQHACCGKLMEEAILPFL